MNGFPKSIFYISLIAFVFDSKLDQSIVLQFSNAIQTRLVRFQLSTIVVDDQRIVQMQL